MIKYSEQAIILIKNLKTFKKDNFEKWYLENLKIGSRDILEYLLNKEKENVK